MKFYDVCHLADHGSEAMVAWCGEVLPEGALHGELGVVILPDVPNADHTEHLICMRCAVLWKQKVEETQRANLTINNTLREIIRLNGESLSTKSGTIRLSEATIASQQEKITELEGVVANLTEMVKDLSKKKKTKGGAEDGN